MNTPIIEQHRDGYTLSSDPARMDRDAIFSYLSRESYWSQGIDRETVERSLDHSLCFGIFDEAGGQVAFARVISDCATFAYLCDVYVLEAQRGKGLGKWLVQAALEHPDLQGLKRWLLFTRDAHGLYRRFGFEVMESTQRLMHIYRPSR